MPTPLNLDRPDLWDVLYEDISGNIVSLRNEIDFGDNYTQTVTSGINPEREEWNLTILTKHPSTLKVLIEGLRAAQPGFVFWTDPYTFAIEGGYVPKKWGMKEGFGVKPITSLIFQTSLKLSKWRS